MTSNLPQILEQLMHLVTIVQCAICSTGLILNGFLVYVIVRNRELRSSPCSIFLLLVAIYDWINEFSLATLPTLLTIADITIPLLTCFFVSSYGPYLFYNMAIMLFTISVDRLASILIPFKYKFMSRQHKWKYVLTVGLIPAFGLLPVTFPLYYNFCKENATIQVHCMPNEMMGKLGGDIGFLINVCANISTLIVYSCFLLCIKFKVLKTSLNSSNDKVDNRIFKSLSVLMAITLLGSLAPAFVFFILPAIPWEQDAKNVLYRWVLQLTKAAQTANGPVLYICSQDYRSAMRKELENIFGLRSPGSTQQNQPNQAALSSNPSNFTSRISPLQSYPSRNVNDFIQR